MIRKILYNFQVFLCYLILIVSILIFIYVALAHALSLLAINQFVDPRVYDANYLKIIISAGFAAALTSMFILIYYKQARYISIISVSLKEKIIYLLIALFISSFLSATKTYPNLLIKTRSLLAFFIFIALFPSLIETYAKMSLSKLSSFMKLQNRFFSRVEKNIFINFISLIVLVMVFAINFLFLFNILINYFNGNVTKERYLRSTLHIAGTDPEKTTHAQKVVIYGYGLGWKRDDRSRILSSDGEIPSSIWTNDKIYFVAPLHLKEGSRQIWVERPKNEEDKKSPIISSNRVNLYLVSRFAYYPDINDNFFIRQYKKIIRILFLQN